MLLLPKRLEDICVDFFERVCLQEDFLEMKQM